MSSPGSVRSDLGHARLVGRIEFLRSLRNARAETNTLVGLGVVGLLVSAATFVVAVAAVQFGDRLATAGEFGQALLRTVPVALWVLLAITVAFRAVTETGRIDGEAGILSATSPRSVVLGLVLAEGYRLFAYVGPPAVVVAVALGVGTGDPLPALALLAVVAGAFATARPGGYLVGIAGLSLSTRVPLVRRNRMKLAGVLLLLYLGFLVLFGDLVLLLAGTPLAWLADPLLVALGAGGAPLLAVVALASPLAVTPAAVAAATRVAEATWYADPVATDDGSDTLLAGVDRVLAPLASRPTASVARKSILRARRAPHTLAFAFVPALGGAGYVAQIVGTGDVPGSFPVVVAAYAGWGVGSAFTLNSLGDEGALLPVTLSTTVSGRQFVRGRVLAAWVAGLPATLAVVAVAAAAAGVPPWKAAGSLSFGVVFSAAAPLVSAGIGTAFPKFDARAVLGSREAVVPSVFALLLFVLVLVPLGLPAFVALTLAGPTAGAFGLPPAALAAIGIAGTGLLCLAAGGVSYAFAVRTFDSYSL